MYVQFFFMREKPKVKIRLEFNDESRSNYLLDVMVVVRQQAESEREKGLEARTLSSGKRPMPKLLAGDSLDGVFQVYFVFPRTQSIKECYRASGHTKQT